MATNIEWKARARDLQRQRALAAALAGTDAELLEQVDTFFHVPQGRLKLRQLGAAHGELIHYHRPDEAGARQSTYARVCTDQPEALLELLGGALGVRGEVRKRRWLYRVGQARIHVDEVEGLGTFLEVEVVLRPGQSPAECQRIAAELRKALEVGEDEVIGGAYVDLLPEES
jgi:predicted adenylyl cyclase CyaB